MKQDNHLLSVFKWVACCQCGKKTTFLEARYLSDDEVFCSDECLIAFLDALNELWINAMENE